MAFDLMLRQQHAYAIPACADLAREHGIEELTLVEFGVAAGAGLLDICDISRRVTRETGMKFRIFNFDTGMGMPLPQSYRDHSEIYQQGDFPMNHDLLRQSLPSNARLLIGRITDTVQPFLRDVSSSSPIGFVSIDVEYYSSTRDALAVFDGKADQYLPRVQPYLDDLEHPAHNSWCGERLAIHEFNQGNELRKIEPHVFLSSIGFSAMRAGSITCSLRMCWIMRADPPCYRSGHRPSLPICTLIKPCLGDDKDDKMNLLETFVSLITGRLERDAATLANRFASPADEISTRHIEIDNFLPDNIARVFYSCFPTPDRMRHMSSFRERNFTFKQLDQVPDLLIHVTLAIQNPKVVAVIESITGIPGQVPVARLYADGITLMRKGDFLNPHIDNSHDSERKLYRRLNLLYYVTPGWQAEYGGNLELWDTSVRHQTVIPSLFNRFVIMETNRFSWHSVSPVSQDAQRCCISNYYFSKRSPEDEDYFHVTSFSARPNQVIRRWIAATDNIARMGIRRIFQQRIGQKRPVSAGRSKVNYFEPIMRACGIGTGLEGRVRTHPLWITLCAF